MQVLLEIDKSYTEKFQTFFSYTLAPYKRKKK